MKIDIPASCVEVDREVCSNTNQCKIHLVKMLVILIEVYTK